MIVLNVAVSINTSWEWLVIISRKLNLVYQAGGTPSQCAFRVWESYNFKCIRIGVSYDICLQSSTMSMTTIQN